MARAIRNFETFHDEDQIWFQHVVRNLRVDVTIDSQHVFNKVSQLANKLLYRIATSDYLHRKSVKDLLVHSFAEVADIPHFLPCLAVATEWKPHAPHDRLLVHVIESVSLEHPKLDTAVYQMHKQVQKAFFPFEAYFHSSEDRYDNAFVADLYGEPDSPSANAMSLLGHEPLAIAKQAMAKFLRNTALPELHQSLPYLYRCEVQRAVYAAMPSALPSEEAVPYLSDSHVRAIRLIVRELPNWTAHELSAGKTPHDLTPPALQAKAASLLESMLGQFTHVVDADP